MFRVIFEHLEKIGLLDMTSSIHRVCLYIVYQPRIQKLLDETLLSWNLHKVRTAGNKTPTALYQLSREKAITQGYWTGDAGDDIETASDPWYGYDPAGGSPPDDELDTDPDSIDRGEYEDAETERRAGVFVNEDYKICEAREILKDMDCLAEDGNSGIDIYCQAVLRVTSYFTKANIDSDSDY